MPGTRERFDSVDVLRGLTVAGMIVVNNPGTWSAVYPWLRHAEWHGCTFADLIFPFFLFVVGVSLALAAGSRGARGVPRDALLRKNAVRAATLVGLGLALNAASFLAFDREAFRFPGVLQRIGLCVLAAGTVYVAGGARAALASAVGLLAGYRILMALGPLDPAGNVAARVDRAVFGSHLLTPEFDPEGLVSTLPAIATTLLGACAGELLRRRAGGRVTVLLAAGAGAAILGLLWGRAFPINKALWTSSYALWTAGLAAIALGLLHAAVDGGGLRRAAAPWIWLGRNAITAFAASSLLTTLLIAIRVDGPGGRTRPLWNAIYRTVFDRFPDPRPGSLLFAMAYLAFWIAACGVLYRKRVFIRV